MTMNKKIRVAVAGLGAIGNRYPQNWLQEPFQVLS